MIDALSFSIKLHIATFAPELIEVFKDLRDIRYKIVCPFHKQNIIYINKPCPTCCFVRRLTKEERKEIFGARPIILKKRRLCK